MTSAEAVLVSLQSHAEVLNALDSNPSLPLNDLRNTHTQKNGLKDEVEYGSHKGKIFVASVSPQVRASLAATYGTTEQEAGWMIEQLLSGPQGMSTGGSYGSQFTWIVDTNAMREACLVLGAEEVVKSISQLKDAPEPSKEGSAETQPKKPILTSACPGWICYAEKTHPHVLPHLSRLRSPQALTGTLLKTVLSKTLNVTPDRIFHLAIMPCFDKKLEASREELTDIYWRTHSENSRPPVRDVDCVITAREILMLAETRSISFPSLPRKPLDPSTRIPFPDSRLDAFLFPQIHPLDRRRPQIPAAGTSGGYLYHILLTQQSIHPGSSIITTRGRNADVVDYTLTLNNETLFRAARYYGFRNIQNLVRKLKPVKKNRMPGARTGGGARKPTVGNGDGDAGKSVELAYVEVMACPGGCTNGGGQIKVEDVGSLQGVDTSSRGQKEWLGRVDEAYHSQASPSPSDDSSSSLPSSASDSSDPDLINSISRTHITSILGHWSQLTDIPLEKLAYTSYRRVESDVGTGGKGEGREAERVVELAGRIGGGW